MHTHHRTLIVCAALLGCTETVSQWSPPICSVVLCDAAFRDGWGPFLPDAVLDDGVSRGDDGTVMVHDRPEGDVGSDAGASDVTLDASDGAVCNYEIHPYGQCSTLTRCPPGCTDCFALSGSNAQGLTVGAGFCRPLPTHSCSSVLGSVQACPVGEVCIEDRNGGLSCIPTSAALAVRAALNSAIGPGGRTSIGFWYSDRTLLGTGVLPPAVCDASLGTCGQGCASCPGDDRCVFASERVPTGICVQRSDFPNPRRCDRRVSSSVYDCTAEESCLLPLRADVDGYSDDRRHGYCLPRARCEAIAARFASDYLCSRRAF